MRYFIALLIVGCSTVPVVPMADGGFPGDADPVLPDTGTDANLPDVGIEPVDAGVDAAPVLEDAAFTDAGQASMDQFEISWAAWHWFTDDAGVEPGAGAGCTSGSSGGYPVNCITAELAAAYCASQGRRLPTRDEWLAEAARYPVQTEVVGATGPGLYIRGDCHTQLCDARGNL